MMLITGKDSKKYSAILLYERIYLKSIVTV